MSDQQVDDQAEDLPVTSPFSAGPGDDDAVDDAVEDAGGTTPFASEPTTGSDENPDDEPDAVARGWVRMGDEAQRNVLYVLAGSSLGVGSLGNSDPPTWIDLSSVTNLDAIGDAQDGVLEVEMCFEDRSPVSAGWPLAFVDAVVVALEAHAAPGDETEPDQSGVSDAHDVDPLHGVPDLGSTTFFEHAPLHADESSALVLEDVTYLSGYPGQAKKRKRCTATLTAEGIAVDGPSGLAFRVGWDVVQTIEAQNADEARFRMNTRIHRDATALVLQCEQAVTIVLEARDCPTLPLRTAVDQLVRDLDVTVV